MPIALMCSGCSRNLQVPESAAGKRVKCPQCGVTQAVGRPASPAAADRPTATRAPANRLAATPLAVTAVPAAAAVAPIGGGFAGFDDLLTGNDFGGPSTAVGGRVGLSPTEIPQAAKKKKRSKAFYWAPGICAIGAAGLNILTLVGCLIFLVWAMIALIQAEVVGAGLLLYPILRLCIFGFFVGGGNIHAIVAGLNLVTMRGRSASAVAIGELFATPIAFGLFFWFLMGWVAGLIFGIGMAVYNWPVAGWVALAIAGEQAKTDFDECDSDDLDKLAEQLQQRASKKSMH